MRKVRLKTLDDYIAISYPPEVVEDTEEGGFVISYPDLPGCITCGETIESAFANAKDAKRAWFEAVWEDETPAMKNFLERLLTHISSLKLCRSVASEDSALNEIVSENNSFSSEAEFKDGVYNVLSMSILCQCGDFYLNVGKSVQMNALSKRKIFSNNERLVGKTDHSFDGVKNRENCVCMMN